MRAAVALLAAVLVAAFAAVFAQAPGQQAPTFKSGVELIAVDVSVVDKTGLPVRSLSADQFNVTVDGKPRRVISAELVDHAAAEAPADRHAKTAEPLRAAYSSNDAPGRSASPGRLIFIVIDQGTFRPLAARAATEAAARFIDRLQPTDRVGLLAFPPPGINIAASKNHAAVRAALPKIVGTADLLRPIGRTQVSVSEAIDITTGDAFTFSAVSARECAGLSSADLRMCQDDIRLAAQAMETNAELRTRQSLDGLRAVVEGVGAIAERKTLVLVSAGFPSSDRAGGALNVNGEVADIARRAERANANLYVLHVDSAFLDAFSAESGRFSETLGRDNAVLAAGIENIASASGGTLFTVVSGADTAFDRVLRETAASYVLGLEPLDTDRDGKPHAIRVNVKVPGAQVRSRREFVLPATAAPTAPTDPLVAALGSRRVATTLPVGVSTHPVGPQPGGRLRVLVTANVGRDLTGPAEFKLALVVSDAAGNVVLASPAKSESLSVPEGSDTRSAAYLTTIVVPPGDYNLRLAAVDGSGHSGSVDHSFSARLAVGEGVTMSDLLLFHPSKASEQLAGVADGRIRSGLVQMHVEVFGRSGGSSPSVTFGVADTPDAAFLIQARGTVSKKDAQGRSTADAVLDLGLLPPGDYVATALVSDGKRRLGARHEALRVEAAAAAAGNSTAGAGSAPRVRFFLGDSTALVRRFDRADVLGPATLRYFADRLAAADPKRSPPAEQALTNLRNARFDEILADLRDTPSDSLSVAFLKGIALLARNELEPAAKELREAIRIADDFLPAAFYLGACYAEGGRTDEAVGAWQTALVTEGDARIVYDVLADALLRLEDAEQTIQVLGEAQGRWPEDEGFLPRQAVAEAMLGRRAEALATLKRYLEKHRADTEAAALGIRLIYESRAAGQAITSPESDRETAATFGEWYRSGGGHNLALVDRWLAFIAKK